MKINEELNTLKESMKYVLENDPRNFKNPYHENGWIYDKVYSWIKGIEEINEQFEYHAPVADVHPVMHGKWNDDVISFYRKCSKCGCCVEWDKKPFLFGSGDYNFCPNCGADMRGDKNETLA